MARKNEQQERGEALEAMTMFSQIGMVMVQQPHVRWRRVWEDQGAAVGVPDAAEYFDWERLDTLQALFLQQQQQQAQPESGGATAEAGHNMARVGRTQQSRPDSRSTQVAKPGQVTGARQGAKARA